VDLLMLALARSLVLLSVLAGAGGPTAEPLPQSCLCAQEPEECLSSAPLVFEGRALTVSMETMPGKTSLLSCQQDLSEPRTVEKGCLLVRAVRDGCKPAQGQRVVLRTSGPGRPREATTGDGGYARWCGLPEGDYTVGLAGGEPATLSLVRSAAAGVFVRLQVVPPARRAWLTEFDVSRTLRGQESKKHTLRIEETDCLYVFKAGVDYRVFAHRDKQGRLTTNGCTPTREKGDSRWICGTEEWLNRKR
jgi:hypothetical protein